MRRLRGIMARPRRGPRETRHRFEGTSSTEPPGPCGSPNRRGVPTPDTEMPKSPIVQVVHPANSRGQSRTSDCRHDSAGKVDERLTAGRQHRVLAGSPLSGRPGGFSRGEYIRVLFQRASPGRGDVEGQFGRAVARIPTVRSPSVTR